MNPSSWSVDEVNTWANEVKLPQGTVMALSQNEVDGSTLVTLTKSDLKSELGLSSLPARRYLWELIKSLRSEQLTNDYSTAISFHEHEIQHYRESSVQSEVSSSIADGADAASGVSGAGNGRSSTDAVVNELITDVQKQRQLVEDHMLAYRLQKEMNAGQVVCEDAELAHQEYERLLQLHDQAERDRVYAESLASTRERAQLNARHRETERHANSADTNTEAASRVSSLFGLCIQTCANNKVNVAEAFSSGKVRPTSIPMVSDDESTEEEEEDRKPAALPSEVFNLPFITHCDVCFERNVKGYSLACGRHLQCVDCMTKLFKTALGDNSLLPLRCCEMPIDMNIAHHLLKPNEADLMHKRIEELQAKNKMYCPFCGAFYNLDLVDSSSFTELQCGCGQHLCIACKTVSHPNLTCRENRGIHSGSDETVLALSREHGWKQCPSCSTMIELRSGCNHMVCFSCKYEFCFRCLRGWNTATSQCSSGTCELWDEDRLLEAGQARVRQEEQALGRRMPERVRRERLHNAVAGLRLNEICTHDWHHSEGYKGDCPNCSFTMYRYGMECVSDCGSVVCYTCAHHRIPERGWN